MNGVDVCSVDNEKVFKANLSVEEIPFEDSLFYVVTAFDFIEHIPRILSTEKDTIYPFVLLMNEVYRVLSLAAYLCIKPLHFHQSRLFKIQPMSIPSRRIHFQFTSVIHNCWQKRLGMDTLEASSLFFKAGLIMHGFCVLWKVYPLNGFVLASCAICKQWPLLQ